MRKYLLLLLVVLTALPALAIASIDYTYQGQRLIYSVDYNKRAASVIKANADISGTLIIPESVPYSGIDCPVTTINSLVFANCTGLTSVEIPCSITSIGYQAFSGCSGLKNVTIADGEGTINFGSHVFLGVELTKLYLGRNISYDKGGLYQYNPPFYQQSSLTELTIGNSVTSIGYRDFSGCSSLKNVTIAEGERTLFFDWEAFSGVELTILYLGRNISYDGHSMYASPFYQQCSLNDLIIGNSVTYISSYLFSGCTGLTYVKLPSSVTSIGDQAFSGCSGLISVEMQYSVTSIGNQAFSGCSGLTSLKIPYSVTSIGDQAFSGCSGLTSFLIPYSVTSIGDQAFSGCGGLKDVAIANSRNPLDFGEDVFSEVELTKLHLGRDLSGGISFKNMSSLSELSIGDCVTSIREGIFSDCSGLSYIKMPNSVISIGNQAFSGCSGLTSIELSNSVTTIGNRAFSGCSGLTTVEIPNSVTSIGEGAFTDCSGIEKVTIADGENTLDCGSTVFYGPNLTELYLGRNLTEHSRFGNIKSLNILTIGNLVTKIVSNAFYDCSSLKDVTIVDGESTIAFGDKVFSGVEIKKLYLGRNISYDTSWGYTPPFCQQSFLTQLTIGNSVTSIENGTFEGCSGLTSVVIPNSVTSIGYGAFKGCSGLASVEIPNSVTTIGNQAFYGCSGLKKVHIGDSVISIGESTFSECSGLTQFHIGASVESIGDFAFYKCSGLTSLDIPNSVKSIDSFVFSGCDGLRRIKCWAVTPPSVSEATFYSESCHLYHNVYLQVPQQSIKDYKAHYVWRRFLEAQRIVLDPEAWQGEEGDSFHISATIYPAAANQQLNWLSSDENVAIVDTEGNVTALNEGTCEIWAFAYPELISSDACIVTVKLKSGIDGNVSDTEETMMYVYGLDGNLVMQTSDRSRLDELYPAIYIVRQGNTVKKIAVK